MLEGIGSRKGGGGATQTSQSQLYDDLGSDRCSDTTVIDVSQGWRSRTPRCLSLFRPL